MPTEQNIDHTKSHNIFAVVFTIAWKPDPFKSAKKKIGP